MNTDRISLFEDSPVQYICSDDCKLAYRDIGRGPPLLLIMGVGGTMNEWDRSLLSHLASVHRLILCDNRGIGDSCPDAREISIPLMAQDIWCLIQALGLTDINIFGYSMGSMIALEICRRWKNLPASLILYAPSLDGEETRRRIDTFVDMNLPEIIRIEALFPDEWLSRQNDISRIFPIPVHPINSRTIIQQLHAVSAWNIPAGSLHPGTIPVLVIVGSEDRITPPLTAEEVARAFSNASFKFIENGGHGAMYQQPDLMGTYIVQFLSGINKGG